MTPQELGSAAASETPTPLEDFAVVREALRAYEGGTGWNADDVLAALARLEARLAEANEGKRVLWQRWQDEIGERQAAEARCEALSAALREIAGVTRTSDDLIRRPGNALDMALKIARVALATSEQARTEEGA